MQYLTREELLRLLATARADNERDFLMILVAFWHGMRASEVTGSTPYDRRAVKKAKHRSAEGLKRSDIQGGFITVRRLKGSLKTVQALVSHDNPLLDEKTALEAYVSNLPGNAKVFDVCRTQFFRLYRRYAQLAGIPKQKWNPHTLKHTCAMMFIKDAGIEHMRQHLGHKSISSTGEYLRVSDQQADRAIAAAAAAL